PPAARVREAEAARDLVDDVGDARAVAARERALAVDDLAERRGNVVEVVVVEDDGAGPRLQREHRRLDVGASERAPETGIAGDAFHRRDQRRLEPAAGTAARLGERSR